MNSDFKDLLAALCRHQVRFLVVGGYAVMFHTEPRFTKDLDIWLEPDPENARRFKQALHEFGAWMEHMSMEDFCTEGVMFQVGLPPARIDFLTSIKGVTFKHAWAERADARIGSDVVPMIGLNDLIEAKRQAGRPQDLLDLDKLEKAAQDADESV